MRVGSGSSFRGRGRDRLERAAPGLLDRRNGEGEPASQARPVALGLDAAPVGLHDPLADGQAQAGPAELPSPLLAVEARELPEQVRQPLRGHARAVVGHREGDVDAVPHHGHPDEGQLVGVPGRVGQQVVQHLDDAPPVRHDPGQVRRQVDLTRLLRSAPALEPAPGLVHQDGHIHGFGCDTGRVPVSMRATSRRSPIRWRMFSDWSRMIRKNWVISAGSSSEAASSRVSADPLMEVSGVLQLVAHHAQELGPQPLQFLQRRHVLHGHDHRLDLALLREDGSGVDQGGDAAPVGGLEHDLLGPHRLPRAQPLGQGELLQGDLPPVGPPEGQHLQQLLRRPAGRAQAADDPSRLPVDRRQAARPRVEDQDAHGRGVHQGLQVRPGPLFLPVPAGVGDDQRRLGGEHHQGLLVLGGELHLLLADVDGPDALTQVADGRGQKGQGELTGKGGRNSGRPNDLM